MSSNKKKKIAKVVRLKYREIKVTIGTSSDDQKAEEIRKNMYIE